MLIHIPFFTHDEKSGEKNLHLSLNALALPKY